MALLLKSPIRHFQTMPPFTGTDQFGRVTILARERALVGLEVARTDTGGEYEEHRPRFHGHFQSSLIGISGAIAITRPMETPLIPCAVRVVIASLILFSFELSWFDWDRDAYTTTRSSTRSIPSDHTVQELKLKTGTREMGQWVAVHCQSMPHPLATPPP